MLVASHSPYPSSLPPRGSASSLGNPSSPSTPSAPDSNALAAPSASKESAAAIRAQSAQLGVDSIVSKHELAPQQKLQRRVTAMSNDLTRYEGRISLAEDLGEAVQQRIQDQWKVLQAVLETSQNVLSQAEVALKTGRQRPEALSNGLDDLNQTLNCFSHSFSHIKALLLASSIRSFDKALAHPAGQALHRSHSDPDRMLSNNDSASDMSLDDSASGDDLSSEGLSVGSASSMSTGYTSDAALYDSDPEGSMPPHISAWAERLTDAFKQPYIMPALSSVDDQATETRLDQTRYFDFQADSLVDHIVNQAKSRRYGQDRLSADVQKLRQIVARLDSDMLPTLGLDSKYAKLERILEHANTASPEKILSDLKKFARTFPALDSNLVRDALESLETGQVALVGAHSLTGSSAELKVSANVHDFLTDQAIASFDMLSADATPRPPVEGALTIEDVYTYRLDPFQFSRTRHHVGEAKDFTTQAQEFWDAAEEHDVQHAIDMLDRVLASPNPADSFVFATYSKDRTTHPLLSCTQFAEADRVTVLNKFIACFEAGWQAYADQHGTLDLKPADSPLSDKEWTFHVLHGSIRNEGEYERPILADVGDDGKRGSDFLLGSDEWQAYKQTLRSVTFTGFDSNPLDGNQTFAHAAVEWKDAALYRTAKEAFGPLTARDIKNQTPLDMLLATFLTNKRVTSHNKAFGRDPSSQTWVLLSEQNRDQLESVQQDYRSNPRRALEFALSVVAERLKFPEFAGPEGKAAIQAKIIDGKNGGLLSYLEASHLEALFNGLDKTTLPLGLRSAIHDFLLQDEAVAA